MRRRWPYGHAPEGIRGDVVNGIEKDPSLNLKLECVLRRGVTFPRAVPEPPNIRGRMRRGRSRLHYSRNQKGNVEESPWSGGVLGKYLLLQIPSWVLLGLGLLIARRWIEIPLWLFAVLLGGWVAKDVILYPFVWRAYASGEKPRRPSPDSIGVVIRELSPSGYIEVDGELWRAEVSDGKRIIPPGKRVRVREMRGFTLLVEPLPPE